MRGNPLVVELELFEGITCAKQNIMAAIFCFDTFKLEGRCCHVFVCRIQHNVFRQREAGSKPALVGELGVAG